MTGKITNSLVSTALKTPLPDGVVHLVMERHGDDVTRKAIVKMRHNHLLGYKPFNWKKVNNKFTIL